MTIGARIKSARQEKGLTQQQLAKAVGIKQSSISDLEHDLTHQPKGSTLVAIAKALQVNPVWIMTGKEPRTAPLSDLPPLSPQMIDLWRRFALMTHEEQSAMLLLFRSTSPIETNTLKPK